MSVAILIQSVLTQLDQLGSGGSATAAVELFFFTLDLYVTAIQERMPLV